MAFNKLEDANALLLYRVGPVLMCSPTLQVESVVVPPAISRANASSDAEPGMFRSMYGMVRVVDLRVRFGVDASLHKQPGQIIIVEVTGGHAGFWVDEIEDVIAFPQTGWSQAPSHVPGSVFSRALMQEGGIRLYAEFDRLDGFKASGYLREHIRNLQQAARHEADEAEENKKPAESRQPEALSSTLNKTAATGHAEMPPETDSEALSQPSSDSKKFEIEKQSSKLFYSTQGDDFNHAQAKAGSKLHPPGENHRQAKIFPSAESDAEEARQKTSRSHRPSPFVKAAAQFHEQPAVHERPARNVAASADKTVSVDDAGMQRQASRPVSTVEQTGSNWLWWFLPLLLLCVVLFLFMQNSRLLQGLVVQGEAPDLQTRVDLQDDIAVTPREKMVDNYVSENESSQTSTDKATITPDAVNAESAVQIAGDLADVVYIEPERGDLTITVNDYEADDTSEDHLPVEASAPDPLPVQHESDTGSKQLQQTHAQEREAETVTEQRQAAALSAGESAETELLPEDEKQQQTGIQAAAAEIEKSTAARGVVDKADVQKSRRLQHIVVKGDTLWSITGRYINKPWLYPEIARLSNIDNPHLIYPGQRVIIVLNYKTRSE